MDCKNALILMGELFDDGTPHTPELKSHLTSCTSCRAKADELATMDAMLSSLPFNAPEGIEEKVLAALAEDRDRRNRPSVIGAMAACGLISAAALNYLLPIAEIETRAWKYIQAWIPDTEWLGSGRSYGDQIAITWSSGVDMFDRVEWVSTSIVWGALASTMVLMMVLNGICAAQLNQVNR